jgi:hypothetical protein
MSAWRLSGDLMVFAHNQVAYTNASTPTTRRWFKALFFSGGS